MRVSPCLVCLRSRCDVLVAYLYNFVVLHQLDLNLNKKLVYQKGPRGQGQGRGTFRAVISSSSRKVAKPSPTRN